MNQALRVTREFLREEGGVTAIEYALMASLIAVAVISTVFLLSQQVQAFYIQVKDCILSPSTCAP